MSVSSLLVLFVWYTSGVLNGEEGGESKSQVEYDLGITLSLRGLEDAAIPHYRLAMEGGGDLADASRVQVARALARSGAPLDEVRTTLQEMEDPMIRSRATMNAIVLYGNSKTPDSGMELALEYARQEADSPYADDALFLTALLQYRSGAFSAARSLLLEILEKYGSGDMIDDAYYFLACIQFTPGNTYNPAMGVAILQKFQRNLGNPLFRDSIWKESVVRLLMRYS
jgi:TPR repeat protein